jgi:hypothetical protein
MRDTAHRRSGTISARLYSAKTGQKYGIASKSVKKSGCITADFDSIPPKPTKKTE